MGYINQEPVLFSGSILDNIRYGNPDATREQVNYVLHLPESALLLPLDALVGLVLCSSVCRSTLSHTSGTTPRYNHGR